VGGKKPRTISTRSVTNILLTTSSGSKLCKRLVLDPEQRQLKAGIMSQDVLNDLGLSMGNYDGSPIRVLDQKNVKPVGSVEAEWVFSDHSHTTHRNTFLVVKMNTCDIILGALYIRQHHLRVYDSPG
jgi:hypothetical protein